MIFATNPQNAKDVDKIEKLLSEMSVGVAAPYSNFTTAIGRDVRKEGRHVLTCAIDSIEKRVGCAFEIVRGYGVRRLTSAEVPDIGLSAIRRSRRAARRGKIRIDRVNVNDMTDYDRRRTTGLSAMLGAIVLISDGRKATAIAAVADPTKPIPPNNILDMFRGEPSK